MIIVDDVTMTAGSTQHAQQLLHLAAEMNIACGIRGNPSKTVISHSPAAYAKCFEPAADGSIKMPSYYMSMLTDKTDIIFNEPIPLKGIIPPHVQFRMLGVFLRFTPSTDDIPMPHSTSPNKWTLVFQAAEKLCKQVTQHLKYKKATIQDARILIQSVLISSLTYRCQLGQLTNADIEQLEQIVFATYCQILQIDKSKRSTHISPNLFLKKDKSGLALPELRTPILGTILCNLAQFLNSVNPIISAIAKYSFLKDHDDRRNHYEPTFPTLHNTLNLLHQERRIFAQTPTDISAFNDKVNCLYRYISTSDVPLCQRDPLYQNSLRKLSTDMPNSNNYLLVLDASHVFESQQYSTQVQTEMISQQNRPRNEVITYQRDINQHIATNPTIGNYGYAVLQEKQRLRLQGKNFIWIYEEQPQQPTYSLNLPCMYCQESFTKKQPPIDCSSPCLLSMQSTLFLYSKRYPQELEMQRLSP